MSSWTGRPAAKRSSGHSPVSRWTMTTSKMKSPRHKHFTHCVLHLIVVNVLLTNSVRAAVAFSGTTEGASAVEPVQVKSGSHPSASQSQLFSTSTTPWTTSSWRNRAVITDPKDNTRHNVHLDQDVSTQKSSVIFFSASLSIFATIGVVIFCRKCVRCPSSRHSRRRHYMPSDGPVGVIVRDEYSSPKIPSSPASSPEHQHCLSTDATSPQQVHFQTEVVIS